MKNSDELLPSEVLAMPLREFERRFGFRPVDALEKHWFAATGKRIARLQRDAIRAGIMGEAPSLSNVNMED